MNIYRRATVSNCIQKKVHLYMAGVHDVSVSEYNKVATIVST